MPIGTPTAVSTGTDLNGGTTTSLKIINYTITAGNLVVLLINTYNQGSTTVRTISSVSDGTNTYVKAKSTSYIVNAGTNAEDLEMWYKENVSAVTNGTLTVTYTTADSNVVGNIVAVQVSGIATTSSLDSTASATNTGTGTSPTVTTGTLAQANSIVFAGNSCYSSGYTEDASFTNLYKDNQDGNGYTYVSIGYKIVAATTAVTHTGSEAISTQWAEIAGVFKGAAAAIVPPPIRRIVYRKK